MAGRRPWPPGPLPAYETADPEGGGVCAGRRVVPRSVSPYKKEFFGILFNHIQLYLTLTFPSRSHTINLPGCRFHSSTLISLNHRLSCLCHFRFKRGPGPNKPKGRRGFIFRSLLFRSPRLRPRPHHAPHSQRKAPGRYNPPYRGLQNGSYGFLEGRAGREL